MRSLMLLPIISVLSTLMFIAPASAADGSVNNEGSSSAGHVEDHAHHVGHSDALMVLLGHKIALQKLQHSAQVLTESSDKNLAQNFSQQSKVFQQVMPILSSYMSTPKSYYLTTQMYHDSLENRSAMLADFTALLVEYQKQLVSVP